MVLAKPGVASAAGTAAKALSGYNGKEAGLTAMPVEVMTIDNLAALDVSHNSIKAVPMGYLSKLRMLRTINFSHNKLTALPEDISLLPALQLLDISHNGLTHLPISFCNASALTSLNASHNELRDLGAGWQQMTRLTVLDVSHNTLRVVPTDVGWLPLTALKLDGNPELRIPASVLQRGLRAVLSYLQVICEQHRLVQQHLDKFAAPAVEANGGVVKAPTEPAALIAHVGRQIQIAGTSGVLDLKSCGYPGVLQQLAPLEVVYVADVRHNSWDELPREILELGGLVVLSASDNCITHIAEGIVPATLGVLNVSFNALSALPASLGSAPVLQQMYVANNKLTDLPATYSQLPMVDLFLSENMFTTIPSAVLGMKKLAKLSIAACQLRCIPDGLGAVTSLKFLDVSFNQLTSLPDSLSCLTSLHAFNASFNPLAVFPPVLGRLTSLSELNLDYTQIHVIPPEIGSLGRLEGLQLEGVPLDSPLDTLYHHSGLLLVQLHNTALTSLDMSGLGLSTLPTQLRALTSLTALDVGNNNLQAIPSWLAQMRGLKHLNLRGNPLVSHQAQVLTMGGEAGLVGLLNPDTDKVDLTGCGLEELPTEVQAHGTRLIQLKLGSNKLTTLPATLAVCTSLATVVLDSNSLTTVPHVLMQMPALSILMLSSNAITCLPDNLGQLTQLQALVMQNNALTALPDCISKLVSLKALSLASNKLTRLPQGLAECSSLRLLDVGSNALTFVPASFARLGSLKSLKLANNSIATLPQQLTNLSGLGELQFTSNKLKIPNMPMNAETREATRRLLTALLAASPSDPNPTPSPRAAQASAPHPACTAAAASTTLTLPRLASVEERAAEQLLAVVSGLGAEVVLKSHPGPAPPLQRQITTAEDAEVLAARRKEVADEEAAATAAAAAAAKLAEERGKQQYVVAHAETLSKDHLRPKQRPHDQVALMDIPRIIGAISTPPAPPPPPKSSKSCTDSSNEGINVSADRCEDTAEEGEEGEDLGRGGANSVKGKRPQAMHRFKRVLDQSALAMNLLGRVHEVLHKPGAVGVDEARTSPQQSTSPTKTAVIVAPATAATASASRLPTIPAPVPVGTGVAAAAAMSNAAAAVTTVPVMPALAASTTPTIQLTAEQAQALKLQQLQAQHLQAAYTQQAQALAMHHAAVGQHANGMAMPVQPNGVTHAHGPPIIGPNGQMYMPMSQMAPAGVHMQQPLNQQLHVQQRTQLQQQQMQLLALQCSHTPQQVSAKPGDMMAHYDSRHVHQVLQLQALQMAQAQQMQQLNAAMSAPVMAPMPAAAMPFSVAGAAANATSTAFKARPGPVFPPPPGKQRSVVTAAK